MTRRKTRQELQEVRDKPCTYTVALQAGAIVATCHLHGSTQPLDTAGARQLAATLCGPLARMEAPTAKPAERLRLAQLLRDAADTLDGRPQQADLEPLDRCYHQVQGR